MVISLANIGTLPALKIADLIGKDQKKLETSPKFLLNEPHFDKKYCRFYSQFLCTYATYVKVTTKHT